MAADLRKASTKNRRAWEPG